MSILSNNLSSKKSFNFMFNASQIYSIISSLIIFLLPDKNLDKVEREIPANVESFDTFRLFSFIKLVKNSYIKKIFMINYDSLINCVKNGGENWKRYMYVSSWL